MRIIFSFIVLLSLTTMAAPLEIKTPADCHKLSANIKDESFKKLFANAINDVNKRYAIDKKFSAGKGGAFVALVKDKEQNDTRKVLKIFPSIETEKNKYNFRELFYTCINSFISYQDLGFTIDGKTKVRAFPQLFEVGMTNANQGGSMVLPYMVMEFVQGQSLTTLGEIANENKNNANYIQRTEYSLYNKDQKPAASTTAALNNKKKTERVVYQIVQMLYKLKRIKINGKDYNFYHADLNAGNVMVRNTTFSGKMNAGFGDISVQDAPIVTFIDFGHSTSDLDNELGSAVNALVTFYHKTLHTLSGSTEEFYENLNGTSLGKIAEGIMGLSSTDSDMRLYRLMARSLFDSNNYVNKALMKHLYDCNTRTKCVEGAPALFKQ